MNLRFSGNQGSDHIFPLLPKSAVAMWQFFFHGKQKEDGEQAIVFQATAIQAIEIERRRQTGGTGHLEQTDRDRALVTN